MSTLNQKNQTKMNNLITKAEHILSIVSNDTNVSSDAVNFVKNRISLMKSVKTDEQYQYYMKKVNN